MLIPAGYMAKRVVRKPDWLKANEVEDIYSVSGCISKDFADYITFWKHNGYWFFDSPEIIAQAAREHSIDLTETTMSIMKFMNKNSMMRKRDGVRMSEKNPSPPVSACQVRRYSQDLMS